MKTFRVLTSQGVFEASLYSELLKNPSLEHLLKILVLTFEKLSLPLKSEIKELIEIGDVKLKREMYFQDKFVTEDFELLLYKEAGDYDLYVLGSTEKVFPLLSHMYNKDEILYTINSWIKQGYRCTLVGSFESDQKIASLNPFHYQSLLHFEGAFCVKG